MAFHRSFNKRIYRTIFWHKKLASLFGFVMFSHQIGAFFGAWLSGILYDMSGDYSLSWIISILLGILATLIHLPIRPIARPAEISGPYRNITGL